MYVETMLNEVTASSRNDVGIRKVVKKGSILAKIKKCKYRATPDSNTRTQVFAFRIQRLRPLGHHVLTYCTTIYINISYNAMVIQKFLATNITYSVNTKFRLFTPFLWEVINITRFWGYLHPRPFCDVTWGPRYKFSHRAPIIFVLPVLFCLRNALSGKLNT